MASSNSSLKIHETCSVSPPPSAPDSSLSLTFFDLNWLRFHPVERLFFYSVPHLQPSSFFDPVLPKLKRSLSVALQHFLPLAGNIVWPSDSAKPFIQYTPGDGVSLVIAVSDSDLNNLLDNSPREAKQSRALVPDLDSSDSSASLISLQITLFPNSGFSIGISAHHACLDGKSTCMFMKAWAYICKTEGERGSSGSLPQDLEPFLDRKVIIDPNGLDVAYTKAWLGLDPTKRSLKILSDMFPPVMDHSVRALFELKRGDLDKIREMVLQKWENNQEEAKEGREESTTLSKPQILSTFVLTTAYVSFSIAKAIERTKKKTKKIFFAFQVDCRSRLEHPVPENYFGNCVRPHAIETPLEDFTSEDGVVKAAKRVHEKIREIQTKGAIEGGGSLFSNRSALSNRDEVQIISVSGSTRFGVYKTDFGWGRPEKVEMISVDRGTTMALAERKDGDGGVEVGLVLNKDVMDQFASLFLTEIESI